MSKNNNGGSAFPYGYQNDSKGMNLRDYLAAKAMQGILSNEAMITNVIEESAAWVSREAYLMADAMLEARGK